MIPILFSPAETQFTSFGLGALADAASCVVKEERNGSFELEMEYPVSGIRYADIESRCIILAKPSPSREPEPFRIYEIKKNGQNIKISAEHLSYDLSGFPVTAFSAESASEALANLKSKSIVSHPFTFSTDVTRSGNFESYTPASTRQLMGGVEGSILDIYHGEWMYSGYSLQLLTARGENRGVKIAYGKNLISVEQDKNISDVYTGVLPFWYSEEKGLVQGTVQTPQGTFDFTRILTLDLSSEFEDAPTVGQLNGKAVDYISEHHVGVPKVSLDVSFADLSKNDPRFLEVVELCDTVTIDFEKLGINAEAKVIKTEYNALLDRYEKISLGDAKESITDTVFEQSSKLKKAPTKSDMEKAIAFATALITGNMGGYVVQHDSDGDGYPDELLIMDLPDIESAQKIWRWNLQGLGYSSTGYDGPYSLAMTVDGQIVADFITTGTLNATNVNVTNINGENIKGKTIGTTPLKDNAVTYDKASAGVQTTLNNVGICINDISALEIRVANLESTWGSFQGISASEWFVFKGKDVAWGTISGTECLVRSNE